MKFKIIEKVAEDLRFFLKHVIINDPRFKETIIVRRELENILIKFDYYDANAELSDYLENKTIELQKISLETYRKKLKIRELLRDSTESYTELIQFINETGKYSK